MECRWRFEGIEQGIDEILDIDECQHLPAVAYTEVEMAVDALYHHQIVLFVGAVHSCGAEYDPGEVGQSAEQCFGFHLRQAVAGVGLRYGAGVERGVAAVFGGGAECAEAAHVQEAPRCESGADDDVGKCAQIAEVDPVEIGEVGAFGGTQVVDHIVPAFSLRKGCGESLGHLCRVIVVEHHEVQPRVGEVAPRC